MAPAWPGSTRRGEAPAGQAWTGLHNKEESNQMEEVTYRIVGEPGEPLIMHNSQLANPLNEFTKAMKELTPKLKKTDQQHADIARLEWRGGLYWNETDGPYLPGLNVRRALLDAARL